MKKIISFALLTSALFFAGCGGNSDIQLPQELAPLTIEQAKNTEQQTVEVFSDLNCAHCRDLEPTIQQLKSALPEADFRFYHFPFLANSSFSSAMAVECLRMEKPEQADHYIMDVFNANNKSIKSLTTLAEKAGADQENFAQCLKKKQTAHIVNAQKQEATNRKVQSTPTIFINGEMYKGARNFETLNTLLSQ